MNTLASAHAASLASLDVLAERVGEAPVRIVFIGAGPAAVMVLERLLASHRRDHPELRLDITLVDPFAPGGGRIWRREQSPLLKLNSMLEDSAFFTDASCTIEGPVEPGPSFAEWVWLVRAGEVARPVWSDELLDREIDTIGPRDFPTRRLNNAYLGWAYDEVLRRASDRVGVTWLKDFAIAVADDGAGASGRTVRLRSGGKLPADLVLHALGHNGSQPSAAAVAIGEFAERHDLAYVAPAFTADVDFDWLPAGEHVIVRGMGLAAVDLAVLLAEGRGGRFERAAGGALQYLPSGREPVLHLGSRRGVPYRSKTTCTPVGEPVRLEYLGEGFREWLAESETPLDFERDVWPLIGAELLTGYYRELFTAHPERVTGDWESFGAALRDTLAAPRGFESPDLVRLVEANVIEPDDRFDITSFDRPLDFAEAQEGVTAGDTDATAVHRRVVSHIERDLRQRTRQAGSATQALFLTMLFSYIAVAEIPAEKWNAYSRSRSLPKRLHTFFSYLASGPPGERLEELLALADAGIVRFLGGEIELLLDDERGRFVASGSARVQDEGGRTRTVRSSVVAGALIDAWLPEAQSVRSDNPLLRGLVTGGYAEELTVADAEHRGGTGQLVVGPDGSLPAAQGQFALGPFTSLPFAGAFTRPGIDSLPFRLHDRCARALLAAAQAQVERSTSHSVASPSRSASARSTSSGEALASKAATTIREKCPALASPGASASPNQVPKLATSS